MSPSVPQHAALPLTRAAWGALEGAAAAAERQRPHQVGTLHVLVGLLHEPDAIAATVLHESGVSDAGIWAAIDFWTGGHLGKMPRRRFNIFARSPEWLPSAHAVLEAAWSEAHDRGAPGVDTGDLLIAIAGDQAKRSRARRVLERAGLDLETARQCIKATRVDRDEQIDERTPPDLAQRRLIAVARADRER